MNRTAFAVVLVAGVCLLGGVFWWKHETPDGRRNRLVQQLAQSKPEYESALRLLHDDGPEGQALLVAGLRRHAEKDNKEYWFGVVLGDIPSLDDPEPYAEVLGELLATRLGAGAMKSLARMGTKAAPALPVVERLLRLDEPLAERHQEAALLYAKLAPAVGPGRGEILGSVLVRCGKQEQSKDDNARIAASACRANLVRACLDGGDVGPVVAAMPSFPEKGREETRGLLREKASKALPALRKMARAGDVTAIAEIGELGRAAVEAAPDLAAALAAAKDDGTRLAAIGALGKLGPGAASGEAEMRQAFAKGDGPVRAAALSALSSLAKDGASLEPEVRSGLKDADAKVRIQALSAASRCGPAVLAEVGAFVRSGDEETRRVAVLALMRAGAAGGEVLGRQVLEAGDDDPTVLGAMYSSRPSADPADRVSMRAALIEAAPAIAKRLKANKPSAVRLLFRAGGKAAVALDGLIGMLSDDEIRWRAGAARVLAEIGPAAKKAVPALVPLAKRGPKSLPITATFALGRIGPEAKEAVPALLLLLDDTDAGVRAVAADALGRIGGPDALAALKARLDPRHKGSAAPLIRSVGLLGPAAAPAVPDLIAILKGKGEIAWHAAAEAVGSIGLAARDALPALEPWMKDKDARRAVAAASAVWAIDPKRADEVAGIVGPLANGSGHDFRPLGMACDLLGRMGPAAVKAVPHLAEAVKSGSYSIRSYGDRDEWSGGVDAERTDTAGDIRRRVTREEQAVSIILRERAADALARIGPAARAAVPALLEAWKKPNSTGFGADEPVRLGREAVGRALKAIDPGAAREAGVP